MDIKVEGLSYEILAEALSQAREGRFHILGILEDSISEPRADYKDFVPRIEKFTIDKEFIGAVIGPGGKIIQEMQKETNTTIMIEEVDDRGVIEIFSADKASIEEAKKRIAMIVTVPEVGTVYEAKVKSLMPYGAFVEILPGKEGLLHVSEIDWKRIDKVEDVLKEGDIISVKLLEVDSRSGKMKLSHKVLVPKPEGYVEERRERRPRDSRDSRDSRGDNRNRPHHGGGDRRRNNNDNR